MNKQKYCAAFLSYFVSLFCPVLIRNANIRFFLADTDWWLSLRSYLTVPVLYLKDNKTGEKLVLDSRVEGCIQGVTLNRSSE